MPKLLTSRTVDTDLEALLHMTEATLATVDLLASRTRPPKTELERQIAIAQVGIDRCRSEVIERYRGLPRISRVLAAGGGVAAWATAL